MQYLLRIRSSPGAFSGAVTFGDFRPAMGLDCTGRQSRSDAISRRMLLIVDALKSGKAPPAESETTEPTWKSYCRLRLPSCSRSIASALSLFSAFSRSALNGERSSLPSSETAVTSMFHEPCTCTSSLTPMALREGFFSKTRSKDVSMFLYRLSPFRKPSVFLQTIVLLEHRSPRKPVTPDFPANANPSPLCSSSPLEAGFSVSSRESLPDRRMPMTVPMNSPIDLVAFIEDHCPRFPSMNSSVYPRLKVFHGSGETPPETLPKEARAYFSGYFSTILSRASE